MSAFLEDFGSVHHTIDRDPSKDHILKRVWIGDQFCFFFQFLVVVFHFLSNANFLNSRNDPKLRFSNEDFIKMRWAENFQTYGWCRSRSNLHHPWVWKFSVQGILVKFWFENHHFGVSKLQTDWIMQTFSKKLVYECVFRGFWIRASYHR